MWQTNVGKFLRQDSSQTAIQIMPSLGSRDFGLVKWPRNWLRHHLRPVLRQGPRSPCKHGLLIRHVILSALGRRKIELLQRACSFVCSRGGRVWRLKKYFGCIIKVQGKCKAGVAAWCLWGKHKGNTMMEFRAVVTSNPGWQLHIGITTACVPLGSLQSEGFGGILAVS